MTATELLAAITAAGGELRRIGDRLSVDVSAPLAPELVGYLHELKGELLSLLAQGPQEAPEALPSVLPDHAPAAGDGRPHAPYIAQCERCHGRRWGPVAPAVPEVLRSGAEVMKETWGCLDCAARPEGTPAPPVPEREHPLLPGAVSNPCPQCNRPDRLFIPGSPHIEGEPDQDVLICGRCGCTEPACLDCKRTNVVIDSQGAYCVDCRRRPGQPEPEPVPRSDPPPVSSRRHQLGETPPPFACPACNHHDWLEGIYSWRCRQCQHIELKPEGPW